jgi:hypothetical protein
MIAALSNARLDVAAGIMSADVGLISNLIGQFAKCANN